MYMLETDDDLMDPEGLAWASWTVADEALLPDLWSSVWVGNESLDRGLEAEEPVFVYSMLLETGDDWAGLDTDRNADWLDVERKGGIMDPWGMLVGESSRLRMPLRDFGSGGSPDSEELIVTSWGL